MRIDKRKNDELRNISIIRNYTKYAEGSVLIEFGLTKVICNASIENKVPHFLKGTGSGWVSAEYSMLPRATQIRRPRDISKLKIDGRTMEIQRLIGRALRSVIDLKALGEKNILIDCDVIQADGGTRTAAITGAFIALVDSINKMNKKSKFKNYPIKDFLSAVSVGIVNNEKIVDLCYYEDSNAMVDMNVVLSGSGKFVELQGAAEKNLFSRDDLDEMLKLAENSCNKITSIQREVLGNDALFIK